MATEYIQPQPHQDFSNNNNVVHRNNSVKDSQKYVPLKSIGNYTFQQSIGKGSMGKVKLGVHNVTGEKVSCSTPSFMHFLLI